MESNALSNYAGNIFLPVWINSNKLAFWYKLVFWNKLVFWYRSGKINSQKWRVPEISGPDIHFSLIWLISYESYVLIFLLVYYFLFWLFLKFSAVLFFRATNLLLALTILIDKKSDETIPMANKIPTTQISLPIIDISSLTQKQSMARSSLPISWIRNFFSALL